VWDDAAERGKGRGEGGFTLIELMVASLVFTIIMTMVFVAISDTVAEFAATNRNLTAQSYANQVSSTLSRLISSATPDPAGSGGATISTDLFGSSASAPAPAVLLSCPDAILFYSDLAYKGVNGGSGEWIYVYLKNDPVASMSNGTSTQLYTVEADIVSTAWAESVAQTDSAALFGSGGSWSQYCGATTGGLTASGGLTPPTPLKVLLQTNGVYAAAAGAQCTEGASGSPCSGPQVFVDIINSGGTIYYNSGYMSDSSSSSNGCSATAPGTPGALNCTTNGQNVVGAYYTLQIKQVTCSVCNLNDVSGGSSHSATLSTQVLMDNVALDNEFGSGVS
jgi:prepilin-type N-terminal cleavage/methylation domain-containing protein